MAHLTLDGITPDSIRNALRSHRKLTPYDYDQELAALVQSYTDDEVTANGSLSLTQRLEASDLMVGGYQIFEITSYPRASRPKGIADEVAAEFLSELPPSDPTHAHVGIGVEFTGDGGIVIGVICANRLLTVSPSPVEQAAHEVVNDYRRDHNRSPLNYDAGIATIARDHSKNMATTGFFSHADPAGNDVVDRYDAASYSYTMAGENIAKRYPKAGQGSTSIAEDIVEGLIDSPPHRENILDSSFSAEGFGIYQDDDGTLYATQNFS